MGSVIRIILEEGELSAHLNDSATALAIEKALPLEGRVNRWGDEVYFSVPLQVAEAMDARQEMQVGELGYWPAGPAFCIFFGPTPVSAGLTPRAYSNVNPFGCLDGEEAMFTKILGNTKDGQKIRVVAASEYA